MANATLMRITLLLAVAVAFGVLATDIAGRRPAPRRCKHPRFRSSPATRPPASSARRRQVGRGQLPREMKDVLRPIRGRQHRAAFLAPGRQTGAKVGQTNVFFFDQNGDQIAGLDVAVTRDSTAYKQRSKRAPERRHQGGRHREDGVMLTGVVANAARIPARLRPCGRPALLAQRLTDSSTTGGTQATSGGAPALPPPPRPAASAAITDRSSTPLPFSAAIRSCSR